MCCWSLETEIDKNVTQTDTDLLLAAVLSP